MRGKGNPFPYVHDPIPEGSGSDVLLAALGREFQKIQDTFRLNHDFEVLHSEPERPKVGMLRFADGTDWNPGSGAGLYECISVTSSAATWNKL